MQNEHVETLKRVSREKAIKYVKHFSTVYQINEKVQPNFWKAVIMLCENPNCDVNLLNIDSSNEAKWCIGRNNVSKYGVDTVLELVQKIAKAIIQNETTPIDPLEIMLMNVKLKKLEDTVKRLEYRHMPCR